MVKITFFFQLYTIPYHTRTLNSNINLRPVWLSSLLLCSVNAHSVSHFCKEWIGQGWGGEECGGERSCWHWLGRLAHLFGVCPDVLEQIREALFYLFFMWSKYGHCLNWLNPLPSSPPYILGSRGALLRVNCDILQNATKQRKTSICWPLKMY